MQTTPEILDRAPMVLGFGPFGPWEWLIILVVILLLFGSKLPRMARNLGRSFIEFKKGIKDTGSEDEPDALPESKPKASLEASKRERAEEEARRSKIHRP